MRRLTPLLLVLAPFACRDRARVEVRAAPEPLPSASASASASVTASVVKPVDTRPPLDPLPPELVDAPPFGDDVKRAACGKREQCKVLREKSAGVDGSGAKLSVISVRAYLGPDEDMETREHWVIGRRGSHIAFRRRMVTEWVAISSRLDDTARVGPNRLEAAVLAWPTSNWQSWPHRTFQLSPPRVLSESSTPLHRDPDFGVFGRVEQSFVDSSGDASFHCSDRHGEYTPIPEGNFARHLNLSKGLGQCAVTVDGSAHHGWMVSGVSDPKSGFMRAVVITAFGETNGYDPDAPPDRLVVEVHDDRWTAGDRLEISRGRQSGFMGCNEETKPTVVYQVGFDGKLSAPAGATSVSNVRVEETDDVRLVSMDLPNKYLEGLTIALRDDDGDGAVRVIATSPMRTSVELGNLEDVQDVACAATPEGLAWAPKLGVDP
ncbi:MAG: hypothetical protein ACHREM_01710 [Polyangiales bacterium]